MTYVSTPAPVPAFVLRLRNNFRGLGSRIVILPHTSESASHLTSAYENTPSSKCNFFPRLRNNFRGLGCKPKNSSAYIRARDRHDLDVRKYACARACLRSSSAKQFSRLGVLVIKKAAGASPRPTCKLRGWVILKKRDVEAPSPTGGVDPPP